MADISTRKPQERTVEVTDPATGENIGLRIGLLSIDDEKMKKSKRAITDQKLHLERRGKGFTAVNIEENTIRICFNAMTGWEWHKDADGDPCTFHGETPDFNLANVTAVLTELPWVEDFITDEISEKKAFFTK